MSKHLIIIGAVAAGTKVAAKARRECEELKITVYTAEEYISYAGCGLPYFISDDIKHKGELLVKTVEDFKSKDNITINILSKVTKIDPVKKEVTVLNIKENKEFVDKYDFLLIATGASPIIPALEGIHLKNIFTLRSVSDALNIKNLINTGNIKRAVIIGGGLIGMECTEAFVKRGIEVTVIELVDQILSPLDKDMADIVEKHCSQKGVAFLKSDGVKSFVGDKSGKVCKVITNNNEVEADIVLLSIGIKPNVDIAREAGIEIGITKAIKVNKRMQTNFSDIYAAGDCVESHNMVTNKPIWLPLGSVANKQGRIAAINLTGGNEEFQGVLGSLIAKVFDLTVAKTGLSKKDAIKLGYNYEAVVVTGKDMTVKLLVNKDNHRLLGCEIVGESLVDNIIDFIATSITVGMKLEDFISLDLAYKPSSSITIDIILTATTKLKDKL